MPASPMLATTGASESRRQGQGVGDTLGNPHRHLGAAQQGVAQDQDSSCLVAQGALAQASIPLGSVQGGACRS